MFKRSSTAIFSPWTWGQQESENQGGEAESGSIESISDWEKYFLCSWISGGADGCLALM
jgi:hypothetical protein